MLKVLTFILALTISPLALADANIGEKAPDFTTTDTNGKEVKISKLEGKFVVLEWTNHDCPFVKKQYDSGKMQSLQSEYTSKDVVWISIISSAPDKQGYVTKEEANELTVKRAAAPSSVVLDPSGEIGRLYGAKTTPHMFIINKDGTLVYKGAIDDKPSANPDDIASSKNYVAQALNELMDGSEVSEPITNQYGCGVKY